MFESGRSHLRKQLAEGQTIGAFWLALGSLALCELAIRARPGAIVIDMQHGLWDRMSLEAVLGIIPPTIPALVRVEENSARCIGQALDAGAEGILVPLVDTAEQARAAVAAARYPPLGARSGGGIRPLGNFVDYVEAANRDIILGVMIETSDGVGNAGTIAATAGVDLVFIGASDLALSLGTFPNPDPRHTKACATIHAACRAANICCGVFTNSAAAAIARRAEGYRLVVSATDIDLVAGGFQQASAAFRAPS
jgi:2-keto-3-deoxy-L-rhamnonate aldolase RhmA